MAGALTDPAADRGTKGVLLVSSLATFGLLTAAMVSENFLTPWRYHQGEYRRMLVGSADERQRQLAEAFAVEVKQIDLPQLGTTDRCVSCHVGIDNPAMADAPQPYRTHPGDYLKHHPVGKYGCTICHRGQGAATNFREAKADDVHWDYPLLPAKFTQASCGACHAPDSPLTLEHAPLLAHGRQLFLDRGCLGCHKLGGVGGQLGPTLDGEGLKIKYQLPMAHVQGAHTLVNWLGQHFDDPQRVVPGSQMRPPRLTPDESDALTTYMLSLSGRDLPGNYVSADRAVARAREIEHKEMDPAVLFGRFCATCHGDGTHGPWDPFFRRFMPAVRGRGLRAVADAAYLRTAVEKGRPGTLMPAWGKGAGGLTPGQIDALVGYLAAGDNTPPPADRRIPDLAGGDGGRGEQLFTQLCAGCHGTNKLAPTLGNSVFQQTAADLFIARTIVQGRPDTAMPAFQRAGTAGLTDAEVRDLVAYVRSLGKPGAAGSPRQ